MWKEWGRHNNYPYFEDMIKHCLNKDELPLAFIAMLEGKLVGTVGLWRCDLKSRQDLFPWLAALYVKKEFRGKGIGTEMQRFVINYCREKGYKQLHLFTEVNNYYEKTGWRHIQDGMNHEGEKVKIYKISTT